jgi:hypothetical protein
MADYPSGGNTFVPNGTYKTRKESYSVPDLTGAEEYIEIPNVPIFDEDEEYDSDKLDTIVRINNERVKDSGDMCPIVVGHTSENDKEIDKPPIVGWAYNFAVSKMGELNPRKVVTATFKVLANYVRRFPRKSVELWQDGVIDPISLLGATRPAKDIGITIFSKQENEGVVRKYSSNAFLIAPEVEDMDKETLIELIAETVENTEVGQYVKGLMNKPEVDEDENAEEAAEEAAEVASEEATEEGKENPTESPVEAPVKEAADEQPEETTDGGAVEKPAEAPADKPEDDEEDKEVPKKHAAVEKYSQESLDTGYRKEKSEHPELDDDAIKKIVDDHLGDDPNYYCEGKLKERYAFELALGKAKEEVRKYQREAEELRGQMVKATRESELTKLANEFTFDLNEEVDYVSSMSPEQYSKHLQIIRTRYSKAPTSKLRVNTVELSDAGGSSALTHDRVMKIVKYAAENQLSYDEAKKKYLEGV